MPEPSDDPNLNSLRSQSDVKLTRDGLKNIFRKLIEGNMGDSKSSESTGMSLDIFRNIIKRWPELEQLCDDQCKQIAAAQNKETRDTVMLTFAQICDDKNIGRKSQKQPRQSQVNIDNI